MEIPLHLEELVSMPAQPKRHALFRAFPAHGLASSPQQNRKGNCNGAYTASPFYSHPGRPPSAVLKAAPKL